MDRNFLIGLLVAVIVIGGGIWAWTSYNPSNTASSTPISATGDVPAGGASGPSATPASAPLAVTTSGAAVSNSTAVVSGQVTPDGAQTSYWYEYGRTTDLGKTTSSQAIGSGFVSIAAPGYITGLAADTQYYFRLVAKNSLGTVTGATYSFTTNDTPPSPATAPGARSLAATDLVRTSASVNGQVDPNSAETSYWFEYGRTADLGNTTTMRSAGNGADAISVSAALSSLAPATTYYYRVDAQNRFGTVTGATLNFTTAGPATPSAPVAVTNAATDVGSTSATLNGSVNPDGDSTTYWFEYSSDSLFGTILGSTTHTETAGAGTSPLNVSASVSNLSNGTQYYYRLVATNSYGTDRGDAVSFTTVPAP
jgi:phosphodiesterase/alkaline phosphatase D-like protein